MEKHDLAIYRNDNRDGFIGAFDNVKNIVEDDTSIEFDSDDGHFKFVKDDNGVYREENNATTLAFRSYNTQCRRTTNKHGYSYSGKVPTGDVHELEYDAEEAEEQSYVDDTEDSDSDISVDDVEVDDSDKEDEEDDRFIIHWVED